MKAGAGGGMGGGGFSHPSRFTESGGVIAGIRWVGILSGYVFMREPEPSRTNRKKSKKNVKCVEKS